MNSRQRISCQPLSGGSDGRRKGTRLAPHDNCRSVLLRSGLRRHLGSCCRARFPVALVERNETVQGLPELTHTGSPTSQTLAPPRGNSSHIALRPTLAPQLSTRRPPSFDLAGSAGCNGRRPRTGRASSLIPRRISTAGSRQDTRDPTYRQDGPTSYRRNVRLRRIIVSWRVKTKKFGRER
jgi:hypothetical protein